MKWAETLHGGEVGLWDRLGVCVPPAPLGGRVSKTLTKMLFSARREQNLDMNHKTKKLSGEPNLVGTRIW